VSHQGRGHDGGADRHGGAAGKGQVQALGERLAGGDQQRLSELVG